MSNNWRSIISFKEALNKLDNDTLHALTVQVGYHYRSGVSRKLYIEAMRGFFRLHSRYEVPKNFTKDTPIKDIVEHMLNSSLGDIPITPLPMKREVLVRWLSNNIDSINFKYDSYEKYMDFTKYGMFRLEDFYTIAFFDVTPSMAFEINEDEDINSDREPFTDVTMDYLNMVLTDITAPYRKDKVKGLPDLNGFTSKITKEKYSRLLLSKEGMSYLGPPLGLDFSDFSVFTTMVDGISFKIMEKYRKYNFDPRDTGEILSKIATTLNAEQASMIKYSPSDEENPFNMNIEEAYTRCINLPIYGKVLTGKVMNDPHEFMELITEKSLEIRSYLPLESKWLNSKLSFSDTVKPHLVKDCPALYTYCVSDDEVKAMMDQTENLFVDNINNVERPTVNLGNFYTADIVGYMYDNYEKYGVSEDIDRTIGTFDDFMSIYSDPTGKTFVGMDLLRINAIKALFDPGEFNQALIAYAFGMIGLNISNIIDHDFDDLYDFVLGGGVGYDKDSERPRISNYCDDISDETMRACLSIFNVSIARILERDALIEIINRGYIYPLPISSEIAQRDATWNGFNLYQRLLYKIYTNSDEPYLVFIQKTEYDIVEDFIDQMFKDSDNLDGFAKRYGMIIPANISPADYISQSFNEMIKIYIRQEGSRPIPKFKPKDISTYEYYTDSDLCKIAKGYPGHTTRGELIRNVFNMLSTKRNNIIETFFWPYPGTNNSINETYIKDYGSKGDEDLSPYADKYPICFGNRRYNYGYSMYQLGTGFDENYGDDGLPTNSSEGSPPGSPRGSPLGGSPDTFGPPLPLGGSPDTFGPPLPLVRSDREFSEDNMELGNVDLDNLPTSKKGRSFRIYNLASNNAKDFKPLTKDQVEQLKTLIINMKNLHSDIDDDKEETETTDRVLKEINICELYINNANEFDRRVIKEFYTFNDSDKNLIRDVFLKIFMAGMYFRQWNGTGPYPMSSTQTMSKGFDKDLSTAKSQNELNGAISLLSRRAKKFIRNIRTVKNINGTITQQREKFGPYWDNIIGRNTYSRNEVAFEQRAIYYSNKTITEDEKSTNDEKELAKANMNAVLSKYGGRLPNFVQIDDTDDSRCIRLASAYLVGTGYHYGYFFNSFTNGEIDNFNPNDVEDIA